MRILVCGGRNFEDRVWLNPILDNYKQSNLTIIQGRARGADRLAYEWAVVNAVPESYPANWYKYGRRAGYLRNMQMLTEGKPDLVIAFPGGVGTAMMCKLAEEAGVKVVRIETISS